MNYQRLRTDLLALGLLAAAVFVGLSLFSYDPLDPPGTLVYPARTHAQNMCGPTGAAAAHFLRDALGTGAWLFFGALLLIDMRMFSRKPLPDPGLRAIGCGFLLAVFCIGVRLWNPAWGTGPLFGSGGYVGALGANLLRVHLSALGSISLLGSMFVAGMVLSTDALLFRILRQAVFLPLLPLKLLQRRPAEAAVAASLTAADSLPVDESETAPAEPEEEELDIPVIAPPPPGSQPAKLAAAPESVDEEIEDEEQPAPSKKMVAAAKAAPAAAPPRKTIRVNPPVSAPPPGYARGTPTPADLAARPHIFPSPGILDVAEEFPYELLAKKARVAATVLEKTFKEFGLNVKVVEIDTGPVITQFELELEAGLRLSKVTALADDLAIALRVPSVRVVAPIPGKNTVGVEVPNDKQVMVRLRELIESSPQELETKRIPIFLGKDVSGRPLTVDLTKMPHLLIAGRTGTGKSVCLNTLILSMLMTRSPEQVKMLMIDPKMVELSPYMRIPHLMHPVITDMKKAEAILAWAVDKMEERYDLLARCGVRHLDSYNKLGREEILRRLGEDPDADTERIPTTMPYIVIIADEMADMIMTSGKDVEGHIIRLAQKSRAVGIHLVLATQKPTVDVITGLIKSNLPARIAFQVASRVDSRVVLDEMGADKLLGNGDMLYLAPGTSNLTRAQGTYVSDDEVNRIIAFYGDQPPQYSQELAQLSTSAAKGKSGIEAIRSRDDMYEQAIEVVVREGRGSVSLLQRCLGIGYGRAARLVDYMAEDGIVGDYNGSQAREVLYTPEQWQAVVAGEPLEEAALS